MGGKLTNHANNFLPALCLAFALLVLAPSRSYADPITAFIAAVVATAKTVGAFSVLGVSVSAGAKFAGGLIASAALSFGARLFTSKKQRTSSTIDRISGLKQTIRDPLKHYRIVYGRARVGTVWVWFNTNGPTNEFLHIFGVLANHPIEQIEQVYFGDQKVYDANDSTFALDANNFILDEQYRNAEINQRLARLYFHTGEYDQEADSTAIAENPGIITAQHRLRGHAYIYIRLQYFQENFPNGIPEITAVIKGKKDIYDPRTGTTGYTNNAALCVRDFLVGKFEEGTRFGNGVDSSEINDNEFIAAANTCDEQVELRDGGAQSRYICEGLLETDDNKLDAKRNLLDSSAGVLTYVGGQFGIKVGEYTPPLITIDEDWFAGPVSVQTNVPKSELFNTVTGVYVAPDKDWEATDFPEVTNPLYRSQDGEILNNEIQFDFVTDSERAQRLAKIALEKARQSISIEADFNLRAMQLTPQDIVAVNLATFGFVNKPFRVIEWGLNENASIRLLLQEESPTAYDWDKGEAVERDPAPNTTLPNPAIVQQPGNLQVEELKFFNVTENGVQSKAVLTWTPSADAFVNQYVVKYRVLPDGDFIAAGTSSASRGVSVERFEIRDLQPAFYEFRVFAINTLGGRSQPAIRQVVIEGLTDRPSNISGLTLNVLDRNAHLKWTPLGTQDLDVTIGGSIEIRHSPDISASWENAIKIGPSLPGVATNAVLPLLNGVYFIKAVDAGGNYSETAASITSTVASVIAFDAVATQAEAPSFSGSKTGLTVSSSKLTFTASSSFTSVSGDFTDAAGLFSKAGGGSGGLYQTEGAYNFSSPVDLGDVYTSRVSIDVRFAPTSSSSLTFTQAAGNFRDRLGVFTGTTEDIKGLSIVPYIRTTDDDPNSTPTWSAWREFYVGDYTARGFDFKLELSSQDSSRNVEISTLTATVDVPERTEIFEDESIVIAGTTLTYSKPFFSKPRLGGIVHTPTGNNYLELAHVSSGGVYTGVMVKIDKGGTYQNGTADVYVTGY